MHRGTITLNSFDRYFTKRHGRTFLRGVRKGLKYIIYIREEKSVLDSSFSRAREATSYRVP